MLSSQVQALAATLPSVLLPTAPTDAVPPALLAQVQGLHEQGLYLQAFHRAQAHLPLEQWTGTRARLLAGRLLYQLGAPKASRLQLLRAFREAPRNAETRYYHSQWVLARKGPLAALDFLSGPVALESTTVELRSDLLLARAEVLSELRDFEDAEHWVKEALALTPERAWAHVVRSHLLEQQDRREEALAAVEHALTLRPFYRPAVQSAANLYTLLGRDEDALALLSAASEKLESAGVCFQLGRLQEELGRYDEAWASLERGLGLCPKLEAQAFAGVAAQRADVAYLRGDVELAVALSYLCGSVFHRRVAERLEARPEGRRLVLPVRFVQQHHKTCAPATLASVAALWGVPVEHLQVAEAICYDGTPAYKERHWAATTGWHVREFRVTWDSARALLDRGIAFTLTTQEPGSSHLQAVVGYDERRGTLLVRDPSSRYLVEFDAEGALAHFASCGPRGMAMVPAAEAARLDGVELPEAELYDGLQRMEEALQAHDRDAARTVVEDLERKAPGHRLTFLARRRLAEYDDSTDDARVALEGLRAAFPDDLNYLLAHLGCLAELGRREERLAALRERATGPKSHPMVWHALASELSADAREEAEAERLLARTLRANRGFAPAYRTLAHLRWSQLRREESLRLYRAAACLEDKDESNAWSYFCAARATGGTARALAFLQDRFRRFGAGSDGPARTLFAALDVLERVTEALGVLERARALRPEDGVLALFTAQAFARLGQADEAERHLAGAEGRVRDGAWYRAAAEVAAARGALEVALGHWKAVLAREPLAADAHSELMSLLTALRGVPEARAHLEAACARFPHHQGLLRLRARWARAHDAEGLLPALDALLSSHPEDAWARRERAWVLSERGRREEALEELERAAALEPHSPSLFHIRGLVLEAAGRTEEAGAAYRESLRLFPALPTVYALVGLATSAAAKREALDTVKEALGAASSPGEPLLAFEEVARDVLEPEALGGYLAQQRERYPEDWACWVAEVRHLQRSKRLDEALEVAREATERFALLGQAWLERALVHRARGEVEAERQALESARRVRPGWARPACELSDLLERKGAVEEARAVLERTARESPMDAMVQGYAADLLWRLGEKDAALERLFQALRLNPDYGWAWERLEEWATETGRRADALALARELAERPHPDPVALWQLAVLLEEDGESTLEARLALLKAAVEAAPRLVDAYDARARMLARAGRYEEALEACAPAVFGGSPPKFLRGRAAWVRALRGELREAVEAMRALVDESPDYLWGWHHLGEWAEELKDTATLTRAAEAQVRLRPDVPHSHFKLGEARAQAGDTKGACEAFERALEVDPKHENSAIRLCDLLLEQGRVGEAERALERVRGEDADALVEAREVLLAVRRENDEAAERHLQRTVARLEDNAWPLSTAVEAMQRKGWGGAVDRVLDAAVARGGSVPGVLARAWGQRQAERWDLWSTWSAWRRLRALSPAASGREAWSAYVEALGERGRGLLLALFLVLHWSTLRGDTWLWGSLGYALVTLRQRRRAWFWLRDWRQRKGELRPWMMLNVVLSARARGKDAEATEAVEHGLSLPGDHTHQALRVWHAFFTALRGEAEPLRKALDEVGPEPSEPLLKLLLRLAGAMRAAHESGYGQARALLDGAQRDVPQAMVNLHGAEAYARMEWRVRQVVGWRAVLRWWLKG